MAGSTKYVCIPEDHRDINNNSILGHCDHEENVKISPGPSLSTSNRQVEVVRVACLLLVHLVHTLQTSRFNVGVVVTRWTYRDLVRNPPIKVRFNVEVNCETMLFLREASIKQIDSVTLAKREYQKRIYCGLSG